MCKQPAEEQEANGGWTIPPGCFPGICSPALSPSLQHHCRTNTLHQAECIIFFLFFFHPIPSTAHTVSCPVISCFKKKRAKENLSSLTRSQCRPSLTALSLHLFISRLAFFERGRFFPHFSFSYPVIRYPQNAFSSIFITRLLPFSSSHQNVGDNIISLSSCRAVKFLRRRRRTGSSISSNSLQTSLSLPLVPLTGVLFTRILVASVEWAFRTTGSKFHPQPGFRRRNV